jgi:hypothetical protein
MNLPVSRISTMRELPLVEGLYSPHIKREKYMSARMDEIDRKFEKFIERLRSHPDPDINAWAAELEELRSELDKEFNVNERGCPTWEKLIRSGVKGATVGRFVYELIQHYVEKDKRGE